MTRNRKGDYARMKESVRQEDIAILSLCAPNNRAVKYVKLKPIKRKGEIGRSTTIVGDLTYSTFNNEQDDQTEMNKQTEQHHKPTRLNNHP